MKVFTPLFQAIIAFCAFFALLSGVIKMFLIPIEGRLDRLEAGQTKIELKLSQRMDGIENRMDSIENRIDSIENRMDSIDSKLDQLLDIKNGKQAVIKSK